MDDLRMIYHVWLDSIKRSMFSVRVILGLILAAILSDLVNRNLVTFAAEKGLAFNAIEAYVANYSYFLAPVLFLSIATFMFCDAPFFSEGQFELMYRTGRRRWFLGKLAYIFSVSLMLQIVMLLTVTIQSMQTAYFGNVWSTLMYSASINNESTAFTVISANMMRNISPYSALIFTVLLNTMLYTLVGLVLFLINMRYKRIYGYAFVLLIVMLALLANYGTIPYIASPMHAGMISYYGFGGLMGRLQVPISGALYLGIPALFFGLLIGWKLKKTSFQFGE